MELPLNQTQGMPQWAHHGSSTTEPPHKEAKLYYSIIIEVFSYFQQKNRVISKYRPHGSNRAGVKSAIGALWYGDQLFCWVKRLININQGTFACVTHRHNGKSGNRTRAIPPCVPFRWPDLKWPRQSLEQGQCTWQRAKPPKHTVNSGAPVCLGELPKMLQADISKTWKVRITTQKRLNESIFPENWELFAVTTDFTGVT